MMKKSPLVGAISAALLSGLPVFVPAALAQEEDDAVFTANIGVTSNYVWRGATQTNNGPAVQGGVDAGLPLGFYVGLWMSNVNFGATEVADVLDQNGNPTGDTVEYSVDAPEYELDGYVGWGMDLTDNVGVDLGYVYYHYGQNESGIDFGEIYGSVSFWWFEVGVNYTANSQIDDDTSAYVVGDVAYYGAFKLDIAESWSVGLTLGQYAFDNDSSDNELSFTWGQIDLTKSAGRYGDFTLSVSQAGEEANGGNDNPRVFITWTKGWNSRA